MSGICGILALDGTAPTDAQIEALVTPLERRGPDGRHVWRRGPVALGHALLATTPESLTETLPLTDEPSGCTITADVRLDNRDELIAALGLADEAIGDGALILSSYLKWGEECPEHLLGDFAFAIWDPRSNQLFCARDHMGMRQFNYCHLSGNLFAFSTEDTSLLAHNEVPGTLNEGRIADFIADLEGFDFTSTFFKNIFRLPPAHSLAVRANELHIRRYWKLHPGTRLELESDEAYGTAFLSIFTEAVRCRMRSAGGVAAMLSGGLDSTSIVAVAAGLRMAAKAGRLTTISAVAPDASQCPETQAIRSALRIGGLDPILISHDEVDGLSNILIGPLKNLRNPFESNGTLLRSIYSAARQGGLNIVLDGGAGDVILTSDNRVASLLASRQYKLAFLEANGAKRFRKPTRPVRFMARKIFSAAWVAFAPIKIRSLWRTVRLSKPLAGAEPRFARRVDFASRRRMADRHVSMKVKSESARRAQSILHPNLTSGRERYDQLAGSFGVESRDPFMDIRLIEFCLSLPPEQLQTDGWPKIILRRAIESLVPQDIAWRRGKEHLGGTFTRSLLATWVDWHESMCDPHSPLGHYLSKRALRDLRKRANKSPNELTWRFFALDRFLRRYDVQSMDIGRPRE